MTPLLKICLTRGGIEALKASRHAMRKMTPAGLLTVVPDGERKGIYAALVLLGSKHGMEILSAIPNLFDHVTREMWLGIGAYASSPALVAETVSHADLITKYRHILESITPEELNTTADGPSLLSRLVSSNGVLLLNDASLFSKITVDGLFAAHQARAHDRSAIWHLCKSQAGHHFLRQIIACEQISLLDDPRFEPHFNQIPDRATLSASQLLVLIGNQGHDLHIQSECLLNQISPERISDLFYAGALIDRPYAMELILAKPFLAEKILPIENLSDDAVGACVSSMFTVTYKTVNMHERATFTENPGSLGYNPDFGGLLTEALGYEAAREAAVGSDSFLDLVMILKASSLSIPLAWMKRMYQSNVGILLLCRYDALWKEFYKVLQSCNDTEQVAFFSELFHTSRSMFRNYLLVRRSEIVRLLKPAHLNTPVHIPLENSTNRHSEQPLMMSISLRELLDQGAIGGSPVNTALTLAIQRIADLPSSQNTERAKEMYRRFSTIHNTSSLSPEDLLTIVSDADLALCFVFCCDSISWITIGHLNHRSGSGPTVLAHLMSSIAGNMIMLRFPEITKLITPEHLQTTLRPDAPGLLAVTVLFRTISAKIALLCYPHLAELFDEHTINCVGDSPDNPHILSLFLDPLGHRLLLAYPRFVDLLSYESLRGLDNDGVHRTLPIITYLSESPLNEPLYDGTAQSMCQSQYYPILLKSLNHDLLNSVPQQTGEFDEQSVLNRLSRFSFFFESDLRFKVTPAGLNHIQRITHDPFDDSPLNQFLAKPFYTISNQRLILSIDHDSGMKRYASNPHIVNMINYKGLTTRLLKELRVHGSTLADYLHDRVVIRILSPHYVGRNVLKTAVKQRYHGQQLYTSEIDDTGDMPAPSNLTCPITQSLFKNPVVIIGGRQIYEYEAIFWHLYISRKCPITQHADLLIDGQTPDDILEPHLRTQVDVLAWLLTRAQSVTLSNINTYDTTGIPELVKLCDNHVGISYLSRSPQLIDAISPTVFNKVITSGSHPGMSPAFLLCLDASGRQLIIEKPVLCGKLDRDGLNHAVHCDDYKGMTALFYLAREHNFVLINRIANMITHAGLYSRGSAFNIMNQSAFLALCAHPSGQHFLYTKLKHLLPDSISELLEFSRVDLFTPLWYLSRRRVGRAVISHVIKQDHDQRQGTQHQHLEISDFYLFLQPVHESSSVMTHLVDELCSADRLESDIDDNRLATHDAYHDKSDGSGMLDETISSMPPLLEQYPQLLEMINTTELNMIPIVNSSNRPATLLHRLMSTARGISLLAKSPSILQRIESVAFNHIVVNTRGLFKGEDHGLSALFLLTSYPEGRLLLLSNPHLIPLIRESTLHHVVSHPEYASQSVLSNLINCPIGLQILHQYPSLVSLINSNTLAKPIHANDINSALLAVLTKNPMGLMLVARHHRAIMQNIFSSESYVSAIKNHISNSMSNSPYQIKRNRTGNTNYPISKEITQKITLNETLSHDEMMACFTQRQWLYYFTQNPDGVDGRMVTFLQTGRTNDGEPVLSRLLSLDEGFLLFSLNSRLQSAISPEIMNDPQDCVESTLAYTMIHTLNGLLTLIQFPKFYRMISEDTLALYNLPSIQNETADQVIYQALIPLIKLRLPNAQSDRSMTIDPLVSAASQLRL